MPPKLGTHTHTHTQQQESSTMPCGDQLAFLPIGFTFTLGWTFSRTHTHEPSTDMAFFREHTHRPQKEKHQSKPTSKYRPKTTEALFRRHVHGKDTDVNSFTPAKRSGDTFRYEHHRVTPRHDGETNRNGGKNQTRCDVGRGHCCESIGNALISVLFRLCDLRTSSRRGAYAPHAPMRWFSGWLGVSESSESWGYNDS